MHTNCSAYSQTIQSLKFNFKENLNLFNNKVNIRCSLITCADKNAINFGIQLYFFFECKKVQENITTSYPNILVWSTHYLSNEDTRVQREGTVFTGVCLSTGGRSLSRGLGVTQLGGGSQQNEYSLYMAGNMPLAFTQEDFFVFIIFLIYEYSHFYYLL